MHLLRKNLQVGVDDTGKIQSLKMQIFCNPGYVANEVTALFAMMASQRYLKQNLLNMLQIGCPVFNY